MKTTEITTLAIVFERLDMWTDEAWLYLSAVEPWRLDGPAAVLVSDEVLPALEDDPDAGIPGTARDRGLMQVVPVATLKDIVANARVQRADATLADLFDALTYYYDHDAFLSLAGESGLSRGSAPIRSVQTRRDPPGALDDHTHSSITTLAADGDAFARSGQFDLALEKYRQALAQLPDPLEEWEAATWLLGAIGDSLFHKGDHAQAREVLQQAMRCPGAIGNPFLHLRLGQSQLELGDLERAKDELARAYMGAGDAIFRDENPRYRLFLKEALRPSEGGSPS